MIVSRVAYQVVLFTLALSLGPTIPLARSQTPQPSVEALQRRIEMLEAQVAELTALVKGGAPSPRSVTPPAVAETLEGDTAASDYLHDLKFGVDLDTYYMYSLNRPIGRINLLRAYDVTSNSFSLNQANVLLESAPDLAAGRRFGGRIDLQWGQATETLQGSAVNEPRPWVYRNVFQAYGTYVAPIGSGLTVDFGKWASSLGFENNYTKDQLNYSRSFWFNFLPFYHMGARVNYKINDAVSVNYWVTNGTQQTEAFNNFKDQFVGVVLQPAKSVSWTAQYYLGQEHPDVQTIQVPTTPTLSTQPGLSIVPVTPYFTGKLHIFDTYATWAASAKTTAGIEGDYVIDRREAPAVDARVFGGAVYARRQLSSAHAVAARAEYLRDRGVFTGLSQSVKEATLTYDYRPSDGFLVRSEWRHDSASLPFFLTRNAGVFDTAQDSVTLGVVWWWGTKRGPW